MTKSHERKREPPSGPLAHVPGLNPEICEVVSPKGPILDLIVITGVSTTATLDQVRHYLAMMYPVLRMGPETR
jgi:hypothetical protein